MLKPTFCPCSSVLKPCSEKEQSQDAMPAEHMPETRSRPSKFYTGMGGTYPWPPKVDAAHELPYYHDVHSINNLALQG